MRKKLVLSLVAAAGAVSMLVPLASKAAPAKAACVVIHRGALNIQLGYAPHGPSDCRQL